MIEPPELVKRAMDATGSSTPTELARALKMTAYSAPRNIQRWLDGVSSPEYESTLQPLEAAGLLGQNSTPVPLRRALDQRELATAIHEIADVLDRLRNLVGEQEHPQAPGRRNG